MNDLKAQMGELRMTLQIKRKATGKTETVELVGRAVDETEEVKESSDGGNAQHSSAG